MRKFFIMPLLGMALAMVPLSAAEVVIKVRPPISIHERRTVRPSPRHVWVGGYHRWDGHAYVWEKGRWEEPPRRHAVWVAPRYIHRHDGYVFVEGHWR
jgi:hypothetical protein